MSNSATIIHVPPGQLANMKYLEIARTRCPTVFGFAGRQNGEIVSEQAVETPTVKDLEDLMAAFKDEHLTMYFGNFPKAVLPDDVQPWLLAFGEDEATKRYLGVMYEGTFSKYSGLNGDHTDEYCVADEVIFPRLEKAYTDCGCDYDKFVEQLQDKSLQRSLMATFEGRGVFIFLPEVGEPISFGQNTVGGEFEWGNTSNAFDYSEKPVVVHDHVTHQTAPQKGRLSFLRGGGKDSTSIASGTAPPTLAPLPSSPHPDANKTAKVVETPPPSTVKIVDGVTYTLMGPPPKLHSHNKAWNKWIRTFNDGNIPPNHQSKDCKVWVAEDLVELARTGPANHQQDVEKLATAVHKIRAKKANVAAEVLVGKEKPITGKFPEAPQPKAKDFLPVMSDADKEKYMGMLAGYLSKGKRPTPLELQKMEERWPRFSQQTGTTFDELVTLSVSERKALFGDAAALWIGELVAKLFGMGYKIEGISSTEVEEKTEVVKPAPVAASGGKNRLAFLRGGR